MEFINYKNEPFLFRPDEKHSETFDYICREFGFEMIETDSARVLVLKKKLSKKKR